MFDWLKRRKTTSLEEFRKEQGYIKERLRVAEEDGKTQAKQEAKEEAKSETKQKNKVKGLFESFQDFASDFAKRQPAMKPLNFGGINGTQRKKKKNTNARNRYGF